ncbi:hypothetical protein, partial [Petrachloros mirabilis]
MLQDPDALPQLIGDYKPVDQWQAHLNHLFYRVRGDQIRNYYQSFASADYRLAHALASDYYERVMAREKARSKRQEATSPASLTSNLVIHEWGP